MRIRFLFVFLILFLTACTPGTAVDPGQVVNLRISAGAQPWLKEAYACAEKQGVVLRLVDLESEADLQLHFGEPPYLGPFAYQIGTDDLIVLAHQDSTLSSLSADQVRDLFARGGDGIQVWVYAPQEDLQQVFETQVLMNGGITSTARLAGSPEQMLQALAADESAVGLTTGRLMDGNVRALYILPQVPVLAIAPAEPQGAIHALIECLQK